MQYRPRNNDWRSSQLILGSIKRSDGSFTEIGEQTLVCLIEAHFTGFKAEIGDTNLNEWHLSGPLTKGKRDGDSTPDQDCQGQPNIRLQSYALEGKQTSVNT